MIKPYSGKESYIFISYSHKDFDEVAVVINGLQNQNYRVWYDEGIDPGTEWDKNIATHVEECEYFIAFISKNYINSSNCKDELNFARDLEKKRFLVYLEEVDLPSEMKMRLSRIQNIHKYRYDKTDDFYSKLFSADELDRCKSNEVKNELKESFKVFIIEEDVLRRYIGKYDSVDVVIPDGIKTIGYYAFDGCENLKSVTIPNSVTNIEAYAFSGCTSLNSVIIPNGVTTVGMYAFNGCTGLDSVTIPNSLKSIGMSAFEGCKNLVSIEIPNSVVSVGAAAFEGCENLTSVTIPSSMASIPNYAFAACDKLSSVIISEGVKSIGNCAFIDCRSLMSVVVPDSVINISEHAFGDYTTIIRNTISNNDNNLEETDSSIINNIIVDSNQACVTTNTEEMSDAKPFGHLATDPRDIVTAEKYVQQFCNPVVLSINNNKNLEFEFIETSSSDEKYAIASRKKSTTEVVFAVFKKIDKNDNPPVAIFEGKKIKKIYRAFMEKHNDECDFVDREKYQPNIQTRQIKGERFTKETACKLFHCWLPLNVEIPAEYAYIESNVFGYVKGLPWESKIVDKLVISNSVRKIEPFAFADIKVKVVVVPTSVVNIGVSAFMLDTDGYIECEENSYAYKYAKDNGLKTSADLIEEQKEMDIIGVSVMTRKTGRKFYEKRDLKNGVFSRPYRYKAKNILPLATISIVEDVEETKKQNKSKDMTDEYKRLGLCQYCGGKLSGLFKKKCSICGKEKDY